METRKFSYLNKHFQATELPNGMRVVSGDVFAEKNKKRSFEVCFAGGRLADTDPPGSGLAFANMLPHLLKEAVSKDMPLDLVRSSFEHGCLRVVYDHQGRDDQDVNCLGLLLESVMQYQPSASACRNARCSTGSTGQDKTNGFWSWFYSKVSPDWQRMCIPTWTEAVFAEQVDRRNTIKYRNRIVHPANSLLFCSDPDLHDDLVYRMAELNPCDIEAQRYVCKPPAVNLLHEEYPYANSARKTLDLLFYIPLPADRMMFLKLAFVFYAIFGRNGYFVNFMKQEKLNLKLETHVTCWPQPFAFIKVTVKVAHVEAVKGVIGLSAVGFSSLRHQDQMRYLNQAVTEVEVDVANPLALIRDEWLGSKEPKIGKEYFPISFEGLKYLAMAHVSESRIGIIQGLPSLPKKISIFSSI